MEIILLHSAMVEASRKIVQALGLDELNVVDETTFVDGKVVRVVGKHSLAVVICPNFSAYPALVVTEEGAARVKSPVDSWVDCLDFINNPPAPPDPVPVYVISAYEFSKRFTMEEEVAIEEASVIDPVIRVAIRKLGLIKNWDVDLSDTGTMNYVGYLATKGLIAPERVAEILAPAGST
jgi:hypothetical protein